MGREQQPKTELDREILTAYAATFIPRFDIYPVQLGDGTYVAVKKDLSSNLVAAHLQGYITIGAYALNQSGWAKWICFDADEEESWLGLWGLAEGLTEQGLVPYLEPSRRGGHLWLFTPAFPGFQVRRFAKQLLAEQHLPERRGQSPGVEIYPGQDRSKGPGSLVRLPLGIHRLTGKRYHFVDVNGQPIAPTIREQVGLLGKPEQISQQFIDQVLDRAPLPKATPPTPPRRVKTENVNGQTLSERIKASTTVYEFVGRYVELDARGKGHCPFHDDQEPSFQVNLEGDYWHCYAQCETRAGNKGGSIIDFWMLWREKHGEDGSFKATIRELAKMLL